MYFSVLHHNRTNMHCIGAAVSSSIMGPYQPQPEPLACPFDKGGAIDPTFLADPLSNLSVVLYKEDGNAIGSGGACGNSNFPNTATAFEYIVVDPRDLITRLDNDTWTPVGNDTSILTNSAIDGANIESPQLWFHGYNGTPFSDQLFKSYHMMFNRGCFADRSYAIGHIVCWGPQLEPPDPRSNYTENNFAQHPDFRTCTWDAYKDSTAHKYQADTIFETGVFPQPNGAPDAYLWAPGGPSVDQEGKYMVFHADLEPGWFDHPNRYNRTRGMFVAEIDYWGQTTGLKASRLILPDSESGG